MVDRIVLIDSADDGFNWMCFVHVTRAQKG